MKLGRYPLCCVWIWRLGISARICGWFFQVKRIKDEIFSQRHDRKRIRVAGVSIKLFGE